MIGNPRLFKIYERHSVVRKDAKSCHPAMYMVCRRPSQRMVNAIQGDVSQSATMQHIYIIKFLAFIVRVAKSKISIGCSMQHDTMCLANRIIPSPSTPNLHKELAGTSMVKDTKHRPKEKGGERCEKVILHFAICLYRTKHLFPQNTLALDAPACKLSQESHTLSR